MAAMTWTAPRGLQAAERTPGDPFNYCLNTGTVRGQKLSLKQQIEVAADAGYDALEPWISDIENYQKDGGSLDDMKKLAADRNVKIVSAIGFAQWIVDDDAQRAKGLEQARHDMGLVKRIGGTHLAAPPRVRPTSRA